MESASGRSKAKNPNEQQTKRKGIARVLANASKLFDYRSRLSSPEHPHHAIASSIASSPGFQPYSLEDAPSASPRANLPTAGKRAVALSTVRTVLKVLRDVGEILDDIPFVKSIAGILIKPVEIAEVCREAPRHLSLWD